MMTIPSFQSALDAARSEFQQVDFEKLRRHNIYIKPFELYLIGTYPPLKAMYDVTPEEVFAGASGQYNVYVHIPFCEQYCTFCHFTKEINPKSDRVTQYLDALHRDIGLIAQTLDHDVHVRTMFFGGGTPSYLLPSQLRALFARMNECLKIDTTGEISFELHPGVIRHQDYEERIEVLKDFGVNRWVFGVQSMDEKVLEKLNRNHTQTEVYGLIDILRRHGCHNMSLDLIYGLPYQTLENWYSTLTSLLKAGVDKLNIFPLFFKKSDPITYQYMHHPEIFPDENTRLIMHFMADFILGECGFVQSPHFFYSKQSKYQFHSEQQEYKFNRIEEINLLPFGVSGFGYVGNTQFFNYCNLDKYMEAVNNNTPPVWRGYTLPLEERQRRTAMFAIRSHGLSRPEFFAKFGIDPVDLFPREFAALNELGLIQEENGYITLSKHGALHAEGIAALFASDQIRERVRATNENILDPRRNDLDIHDFSPLEKYKTVGAVEA